MPADWLIRNARVIDGTGQQAFDADVVVDAGSITQILRRPGDAPAARRTVDAAGRVLCPGFIDMHAHSDIQILANPEHTAKVSQGVTLEVLGQDGLSFAPVDDPRAPPCWSRSPAGTAHPRTSPTTGTRSPRTWTGSTVASPATPPTSSPRAPCASWSSDRTTVEHRRRSSRRWGSSSPRGCAREPSG